MTIDKAAYAPTCVSVPLGGVLAEVWDTLDRALLAAVGGRLRDPIPILASAGRARPHDRVAGAMRSRRRSL
jgi:hypothetical protein